MSLDVLAASEWVVASLAGRPGSGHVVLHSNDARCVHPLKRDVAAYARVSPPVSWSEAHLLARQLDEAKKVLES